MPYSKVSVQKTQDIVDFIKKADGLFTIRDVSEKFLVDKSFVSRQASSNNIKLKRMQAEPGEMRQRLRFIRDNTQLTRRQMSDFLDISYQQVNSICRKYNISPTIGISTKEEREEYRIFIAENPHMTLLKLSRELNISVTSVQKYCKTFNLPFTNARTGNQHEKFDSNLKIRKPKKNMVNDLLRKSWKN